MSQDHPEFNSPPPQIKLRRYSKTDKQDFIKLNLDWIEEYFSVEESDSEQLKELETSILGTGGQIVVAELDGIIVGVGAIRPPQHQPNDGHKWLEIIKMTTHKDQRGKGIGRAILVALIKEARAKYADAIWLETNDILDSATRLYEKCGFRHLSCEEWWPTPYERCNVQMVLVL